MTSRLLPLVALLLTFGAAASLPARAQEVTTTATHAYLIDDTTGAVLFEKNANQRMHPSSMSKLMTVYMVFERLNEGRLKMDDTFPVTEKAWRMQGSKMFVALNSRVSVEDLLRGVIIQSGNDACIVLAEGLGNSEAAFAEEMTKRGKALGLTNSTFINASGWPHDDHLTTPHDLAILAKSLIDTFPEYYKIYSEKEFTYNGIKQGNRNPLLYKDTGTDGLKTGHTEAAGYGLVASAKRGDRRLILVLNGMKSVNERSREAERLMDWGFREFGNYALFKAGDTIAEAPVWLGDKATVPLVAEKNVVATMTKKSRNGMQVKVKYDEPIAAPIAKGTKVGTIQITAPDMKPVEIALLTGGAVEQLGVLGRLGAAVSYLLMGPPTPPKN